MTKVNQAQVAVREFSWK